MPRHGAACQESTDGKSSPEVTGLETPVQELVSSPVSERSEGDGRVQEGSQVPSGITLANTGLVRPVCQALFGVRLL